MGCAALRNLLTSNPELAAVYVNRSYSKELAVASGFFKASIGSRALSLGLGKLCSAYIQWSAGTLGLTGQSAGLVSQRGDT